MDKIEVNTKKLGSITLVGKFKDGEASLICEQNKLLYTMKYPLLKDLTSEQAWQIYEYCGRVPEEPFDVALKFGVLYDIGNNRVE
ncbi:MAG: hypothetical protein II453_18760 [Alphaproteobacteria bacterium]|nr:hypothetical protein [Alphaproteobacteria bacterium]MBQ4010396.1 hypothetical protein [Bacteroidales bacterium]